MYFPNEFALIMTCVFLHTVPDISPKKKYKHNINNKSYLSYQVDEWDYWVFADWVPYQDPSTGWVWLWSFHNQTWRWMTQEEDYCIFSIAYNSTRFVKNIIYYNMM